MLHDGEQKAPLSVWLLWAHLIIGRMLINIYQCYIKSINDNINNIMKSHSTTSKNNYYRFIIKIIRTSIKNAFCDLFVENDKKYHKISDPYPKSKFDTILDEFLQRSIKLYGIYYDREKTRREMYDLADKRDVNEFVGFVTAIWC